LRGDRLERVQGSGRGDSAAGRAGIRDGVPDDARSVLRLPQSVGQTVSAPDDSDFTVSGDHQLRSGRELAAVGALPAAILRLRRATTKHEAQYKQDCGALPGREPFSP